MIFGYAGTFGEPEIFQALAGRELKWEKRIVEGLELVFQPFAKINPIVRERLLTNWDSHEFYGAYSLRARDDAKTVVTFYEVDDEYANTVVIPRLADWNMYDLGWFRPDKLEGQFNGNSVEIRTEILAGGEVLQARSNFGTSSTYIRFAREMFKRLRNEFGAAVEGQVISSPER